tara:strand:+ start:195 stop:425 length:231 start_codon:yes stop_codon:yes gene_type:complete
VVAVDKEDGITIQVPERVDLVVVVLVRLMPQVLVVLMALVVEVVLEIQDWVPDMVVAVVVEYIQILRSLVLDLMRL